MNKYIKHKLHWIFVFLIIGATAIPSYAQVGKSLYILRKAGRMPPEDLFIRANLPTDLASLLERRAVRNPMQGYASSIQNFQQIQNLSVRQIWEYGGRNPAFCFPEHKSPIVERLLNNLPSGTELIPVEGVSLNPLYDDAATLDLWIDLAGERNIGPQKIILAMSACKKIDQFLFTEKDGQVFLNVPVIKHFRSYGPALEGLARTLSSLVQAPLFTQSVDQFIMRRNQQIATSIQKHLNAVEAIATRDITTQRTAEEIEQLVNNLDEQNPLRISVEAALRNTAKDGYIRPVVDPER